MTKSLEDKSLQKVIQNHNLFLLKEVNKCETWLLSIKLAHEYILNTDCCLTTWPQTCREISQQEKVLRQMPQLKQKRVKKSSTTGDYFQP